MVRGVDPHEGWWFCALELFSARQQVVVLHGLAPMVYYGMPASRFSRHQLIIPRGWSHLVVSFFSGTSYVLSYDSAFGNTIGRCLHCQKASDKSVVQSICNASSCEPGEHDGGVWPSADHLVYSRRCRCCCCCSLTFFHLLRLMTGGATVISLVLIPWLPLCLST